MDIGWTAFFLDGLSIAGYPICLATKIPPDLPGGCEVKRFRDKVRDITRRTRGCSLQQVIDELTDYMRGWWGYFGLIESHNRLRPLDHWVRRRLRALLWKQWKNRRTRVEELRKRGLSRLYALTTGCARKGAWRMSRVKWVVLALPDSYFHSLGLVFHWLEPA